MKLSMFNFFAPLLILGLVSGCGNDSASTNTDPASGSSSSVGKLSPPSVTNTAPFNGETNIGIGTTITATFSMIMKYTTINNTTFTVKDALNNPVPGTISFVGLDAVFTPNAPLQTNTNYLVTLSGAIESKDGNGLKPLTWSFNTSTSLTPLQLSSHYINDNSVFGGSSFVYDNIAVTGTNSGITGDDTAGSIPIGFTFNFYGTDYTTVNVSTNGHLTFGALDSRYGNYPFPSNDGRPRIAAWFDDLYIDGPGKIVYQVMGTAPNRRLVVQWNQVRHFNGATRGDFEIILLEGNNVIHFQYLNSNLTPNANGSSATVGLNKGDGIDNSLYSFNTASLANNRIITFVPTTALGFNTNSPLIPQNGAVNVPRSVILYAFFNKPLDAASLSTAFTLAETVSGLPVANNAFLVGAGNAVILSLPNSLFAALTNYTANISTGLTDMNGVNLTAPITWSFTTGTGF